MKKNITVETSAAKQPTVTLIVTGNVEKFADITPNKLVLRGNAGDPITGTVTLTPDPKYPFKILETKSKNGTDIQAKIEEKKDGDTVRYILTVENLKKDPGRYSDVVQLKTDSTVKPEIEVSVYGQIMETPKQATAETPKPNLPESPRPNP